mmetsp:Transcript_17251/g.24378  ORF Transcript_17251/g.24378 Transcript_17251/m.24378 type:complete len:675 (+) Transcript_17251:38-2062(+)
MNTNVDFAKVLSQCVSLFSIINICFDTVAVEAFVTNENTIHLDKPYETSKRRKSFGVHTFQKIGNFISFSNVNPNDEHENEGEIFYDDFGDVFPSFAPEDNNILNEISQPFTILDDSLVERLARTRLVESERIEQTSINRQTGNWGVRGFSLDPFPEENSNLVGGDIDEKSTFIGGDEQDTMKEVKRRDGPRLYGSNNEESVESLNSSNTKIRICLLASDVSSSKNDVIVAGRTDGSVCLVRLGTEYFARFVNGDKTIPVGDWNGDGSTDTSVRFEKSFVRQDSFHPSSLEDEMSLQNEIHENQEQMEEEPFEILHRVNAGSQPVTAILYDDSDLYVSCGSTGLVKAWGNVEEDQEASVNLMWEKRIHHDGSRIIKIKAIKDGTSICSVDSKGVIVLWNAKNGEDIFRCKGIQDEDVSCLSADIDYESSIVYLGLSTGTVLAYSISDIKENMFIQQNSFVEPCLQFFAHDDTKLGEDGRIGVTAIRFVPSLPSSSRNLNPSSTIFTGGSDGYVKRWDIIARSKPSSSKSDKSTIKLEHWPRLSNQKCRSNLAHSFRGHDGPINDISYTPAVSGRFDNNPTMSKENLNLEKGATLLSSGQDGTLRAWDVLQGKELYRMDGFTNNEGGTSSEYQGSSTLCFDGEVLVTDGMGEYVCVHDFNIEDEDEGEIDHYLEW